ncbi:hypothetical protein BC351_25105 [Paenibacillus ferrarius]|uniref:DUF695 domain-containing protein n=1 Tax=Paenibacillus ferrarius TaxID=1469647 RepID=A0A1V4HKT8_9BACL|nr:DUF695 domain-containing protein [Paenibacillus ferrarius]OPH57152.1 hypothetical protein BC351_25105 [Paenibacillus ferrarius]
MEEDWNLFERDRDREPILIFMNTALKPNAPYLGYGQLITIVFNMYSLWDLSGSNKQKAQQLFYSLEDKLISRMKDRGVSLYAGRISANHTMEMHFYAKDDWDGELELKRMLADFPSFRYYFRMQHDPDWLFYLKEMFPSPLEEQWMRNAKIVYALKRHGDKLEIAREVQHWLRFPDATPLIEVKRKVGQLGYQVIAAKLDTRGSTEMHVLHVSMKHALDVPTVNTVTRQLFLLAAESGGTYDGWGTQLVLKLPAKIRVYFKRMMKKVLAVFK